MGIGAHFNVMIGSKASNGGTEVVARSDAQQQRRLLRPRLTVLEDNGNPNAAVVHDAQQ